MTTDRLIDLRELKYRIFGVDDTNKEVILCSYYAAQNSWNRERSIEYSSYSNKYSILEMPSINEDVPK